jgi:hypothetical protein
VIIHQCWADIATDCSRGKEKGSNDHEEATHSVNRSAHRLSVAVVQLLRF